MTTTNDNEDDDNNNYNGNDNQIDFQSHRLSIWRAKQASGRAGGRAHSYAVNFIMAENPATEYFRAHFRECTHFDVDSTARFCLYRTQLNRAKIFYVPAVSVTSALYTCSVWLANSLISNGCLIETTEIVMRNTATMSMMTRKISMTSDGIRQGMSEVKAKVNEKWNTSYEDKYSQQTEGSIIFSNSANSIVHRMQITGGMNKACYVSIRATERRSDAKECIKRSMNIFKCDLNSANTHTRQSKNRHM